VKGLATPRTPYRECPALRCEERLKPVTREGRDADAGQEDEGGAHVGNLAVCSAVDGRVAREGDEGVDCKGNHVPDGECALAQRRRKDHLETEHDCSTTPF
jgi:hypothetical protein